MTQDTQGHEGTHTLQDLHNIRADKKGLNKEQLVYVGCASYARTAMLANMNAVLQGKSERLYKKTDDELIQEAKIFYKDYIDAIKSLNAITG